MNLSITKISTYLDCPRKYWYSYDLGIQTPKSEGFFFGSAVHEGLENYYSGKNPDEAIRNALFSKKDKVGETAKEGVDPYKLYREAKRIIKIYPEQAPYFEPILVEHFFKVKLIHPETKEELPAGFVGKIDLITVDNKIVDHKTSNSSPNGFFENKNNLQANGYAYAYLMMFGKLPEEFVFNYLIKGNTKREPSIEYKILKPQLGDICVFIDQCKHILDVILKGKTRDCPNQNHCRWCQFKNICQYNK
jgi:CRISPR/Cas system-associated exonuclease Cas4 (RecB family)